MNRNAALILAVLAATQGCNRDKSADSAPQQQAKTPTLTDTGRSLASSAKTKTATGGAPAGAPAAPPSTPSTPTPAAAAAAAAANELASARRVLTVQVASFVNAATAQALRERLERAGVPVWTTTTTVDGQDFTRVRIGAAVTPAEAHAVAQKIQATYHWPVWITVVENRSALPVDALTTTRTYAGGT